LLQGVAIPAPTLARRYGRVLKHLASTRWLEVCVLQASPLLGCYLGARGHLEHSVGELALLLVGSTALTAHVFVFNDWADYDDDARDPRRDTRGADGYRITRDEIAHVAVALAVVALVTLAAVSTTALLIGAAIAALGIVYSFSPVLGKRAPIAASLNHVIGGALHFLLGYTVVSAVDARGVALSLFFGLVFASGHLNQEVRDYESDLAGGVPTSAVTFGRRTCFLASFSLFTVAYLLLAGLAAFGVVPRILLVCAIAWALQAGWSLQALRDGLGFEAAMWIQRRYRLLFALVGLLLLVR
jgi:4-hydroxybenzoate polyprenyltransferase